MTAWRCPCDILHQYLINNLLSGIRHAGWQKLTNTDAERGSGFGDLELGETKTTRSQRVRVRLSVSGPAGNSLIVTNYYQSGRICDKLSRFPLLRGFGPQLGHPNLTVKALLPL